MAQQSNHTHIQADMPEAIYSNNVCESKKLEPNWVLISREMYKFWQVAIINDGYQIKNIPLHDERV